MDPSSSLDLRQQAIAAAMNCLWDKALNLNRQILKSDPGNVDALNRTARAYFELEDVIKAKKYYSLTLNIDPYNPIALKNLKILKAVKQPSNGHSKNGSLSKKEFVQKINFSSSLFLEEPGKTKVVTLLKVTEPQVLCQVSCGLKVELQIKARGITVSSPECGYLGVLPDDLAFQIIRLVKGGNRFEACIKSVKVNSLSILIREIFRSQRFKNQPSFLENMHSYTDSFWDNRKITEEKFFVSEE